tara:strand:- start:509 stop:907 length:399 start_codon:yes stop_codon:yes gene_type:complete
MPHLGKRSLQHLVTLDLELQEILQEAIKHFDFTITCGHRTQKEQDDLFNATPKRTQVNWPNSKHNPYPSQAVDIAPYPVDYNDRERFTYLAGFVMGIAKMKGIPLRWGGDWDDDTEVKNNKFDDMPHFELVS